MDQEQKERLEQELRFLEESLEADIISTEEFAKGKERIEQKLNEPEEIKPKEEKKARTRRVKANKTAEENISDDENQKESDTRHVENSKEELETYIEEEKEEEEKPEEAVEEEREDVEEKREDIEEDIGQEGFGEEEFDDDKKKKVKKAKPKRKWLLWAGLIIMLFLLYFLVKGHNEGNKALKNETIPETALLCSTNEDCQNPGKIGLCMNPSTNDARCEFRDDIKISLILVNDDKCKSCDTGRMVQIIKQIFPGAEEETIQYNSPEGLKLIEETNLVSLPSYIFDASIAKAANFDKFERALVKKGEKYIITPSASGAEYYFKRTEAKNKLELFVIDNLDSSLKAEKNVKDVLELFGSKITFTKKIVSEAEKETLLKELGVTSYPVFLVNNRLKFGGVRSPEAIKEKFCELNALDECKNKLLENIR